MIDLDDVSDEQLHIWLGEWRRKERTKNEIERTELDDPKSHGKLITRLWRERLRIETEAVHPLRREVGRLRRKLLAHGIDPDE